MSMPSFQLPLTFFSRRNPQDKLNPADHLKMLLEESGYRIFDVDVDIQLPIHSDNMVAVHPDDTSSVISIYRRSDDVFIVRPFVDSAALGQFTERLTGKNLEGIVLKLVRNLILREDDDDWGSWLSEESKEKAREFEYL